MQAAWAMLSGGACGAIPVPHHSLNEVNKLNQLCSLYLKCQNCSCGQEDQDWGGPHQQDNTCVGQHPGSTLSVPFSGPTALADITSQQFAPKL